jgi:ribosomal protein S18 acetylase RimI-like enzyme
MTDPLPLHIPVAIDAAAEVDFSLPAAPDFEPLARDRVPVRSLKADDLGAIARIDRKITGRDRSAYLARKLDEALYDSAVRVSLVAELDGRPVGFVMARVDFGEFGRAEPVAVLDTIGVDPDYARRAVGGALLQQLLANLAGLRIERIETEVAHDNLGLLGFLYAQGFAPSQRLAFRLRAGG